MVSKTNFTGIFTKDIEERITLKDIIKERKANEKRIEKIMKDYLAKKKNKCSTHMCGY